MGNRVILGNRGSTYGLFVSQNGVDVTDTSLTTGLAFDSRSIRGLVIHSKGEGSIAATTANSLGAYTAGTATISHGLGYIPLVAVRWCYASDLSSGVATRMYSPSQGYFSQGGFDQADDEETSDWEESTSVGIDVSLSTSNLLITNHEYGYACEVGDDQAGLPSGIEDQFGTNAQAIYYAYIIFKAKDFTGGLGL